MEYKNTLVTRKTIAERYAIASKTISDLGRQGAFGEQFVLADAKQLGKVTSDEPLKGNHPLYYSLEALKDFELTRCKNPETYEFKPDGSFIPVEEALAFLGYSKGTELKCISKTVMDIANPINIGTLERTFWRFRIDLLEEAKKFRTGRAIETHEQPELPTGEKQEEEKAMFDLFKKFMEIYKEEREEK